MICKRFMHPTDADLELEVCYEDGKPGYRSTHATLTTRSLTSGRVAGTGIPAELARRATCRVGSVPPEIIARLVAYTSTLPGVE